jgi:hypothetical protein
MLGFETVSEALRRKVARRITRQVEGVGDRGPEERIAERVEHQRERALCDVMFLMPDRELGNERTDRIEDRVQRIAIASDDHPGRERSRAFLTERIETLIDDHPGVSLAGAGPLDGIGDAGSDRIRDRPRELPLQAGRRSEMVEKVGVGPTDLGCDRLQRDGLRSLLEQKPARRG